MSTTPRLVLDRRRLDANLTAMAQRVRALGATLRPHVKTHKSPEIMRRQLALGAHGITAATLHEAEAMVAAGAGDVLVAYPPVGEDRRARLAALAGSARITVACSEQAHLDALAGLPEEIGFYWEVDCGAGRLGTPPGEPTVRALDGAAEHLRGIMTFAGHAYAGGDPGEVAAMEDAALAETADALRAHGIDPGELSAGATPLAGAHRSGTASEYRFGNYVFKDATQVALGSATPDECALTVEATVVGRPDERRVILDAGSKALAAERTAADGFGIVRDHPELRVTQLYEEHAICLAAEPSPLRVGDRVHVIPNHACTCANLHPAYFVDDETWPLAARGWTAT